jgi:hypothetical protein
LNCRSSASAPIRRLQGPLLAKLPRSGTISGPMTRDASRRERNGVHPEREPIWMAADECRRPPSPRPPDPGLESAGRLTRSFIQGFASRRVGPPAGRDNFRMLISRAGRRCSSRYSRYGVNTSSIHFMNTRTRRDRLLRCATTRDTASARRRKSGMISTSAPLSKYRPIPKSGA